MARKHTTYAPALVAAGAGPAAGAAPAAAAAKGTVVHDTRFPDSAGGRAAAAAYSPCYVWVHVDAAYGGAYCVCPEYQTHMDGVELCDSVVVNAHKKLLVTFDCAVMWVADRRPVLDALSLTPEYLRNDFNTLDYKDWQLPLGEEVQGAEAVVHAAQLRHERAAEAHPCRCGVRPAP